MAAEDPNAVLAGIDDIKSEWIGNPDPWAMGAQSREHARQTIDDLGAIEFEAVEAQRANMLADHRRKEGSDEQLAAKGEKLAEQIAETSAAEGRGPALRKLTDEAAKIAEMQRWREGRGR